MSAVPSSTINENHCPPALVGASSRNYVIYPVKLLSPKSLSWSIEGIEVGSTFCKLTPSFIPLWVYW